MGIDPDGGKTSKGHGVALYEDEKLVSLNNFTLLQLRDFLLAFFGDDYTALEIHMEDNASVDAAYTAEKAKLPPQYSSKKQLKIRFNIAQKIGMCKQAQIELEQMFKELKITVIKKKQSKRWKATGMETDMFKRATGWAGLSNEDTRSAAYFGYLGARERNLLKKVKG